MCDAATTPVDAMAPRQPIVFFLTRGSVRSPKVVGSAESHPPLSKIWDAEGGNAVPLPLGEDVFAAAPHNDLMMILPITSKSRADKERDAEQKANVARAWTPATQHVAEIGFFAAGGTPAPGRQFSSRCPGSRCIPTGTGCSGGRAAIALKGTA
jgi:hypothetical protein